MRVGVRRGLHVWGGSLRRELFAVCCQRLFCDLSAADCRAQRDRQGVPRAGAVRKLTWPVPARIHRGCHHPVALLVPSPFSLLLRFNHSFVVAW